MAHSPVPPPLKVAALVFSPVPSLRTAAAAESVLRGVKGARTELVLVREFKDFDGAIHACDAASAVVFASPTYNADVAWPLKAFLDSVASQRSLTGAHPLAGKACATVTTAASERHYLSAEHVRGVLSSVYIMQTLSPNLCLWNEHFSDDRALTESADEMCGKLGGALVDLARAVNTSSAIQELRGGG